MGSSKGDTTYEQFLKERQSDNMFENDVSLKFNFQNSFFLVFGARVQILGDTGGQRGENQENLDQFKTKECTWRCRLENF